MFDFTERTELLIGRDALEKLARARVLLFGLGGVGGSCGEALVRAGIGHITAVDGDTVSLSNINRQVLALHSNVGMLKTEAFRRRALDINPALDIETVPEFYGRAERNSIDFSGFDHIVDCIDDVPAKVAIIVRAREAGRPVITCMGAGNRFEMPVFNVIDLFQTSGDPLARAMRQALRKAGVDSGVPAVISDTSAVRTASPHTVASISYVPEAAGLTVAAAVIRRILLPGTGYLPKTTICGKMKEKGE